jgi:hypothetical protein
MYKAIRTGDAAHRKDHGFKGLQTEENSEWDSGLNPTVRGRSQVSQRCTQSGRLTIGKFPPRKNGPKAGELLDDLGGENFAKLC